MASREQRQQIRDIFSSEGPMHIDRLVSLLQQRELYTPEQVGKFALRAMKADAREALSEVGVKDAPPGIGYAYPVPNGSEDEDDDGRPVWKQTVLFDYEEMSALIALNVKRVGDDWQVMVLNLHGYCRERFGKAPSIPELTSELV